MRLNYMRLVIVLVGAGTAGLILSLAPAAHGASERDYVDGILDGLVRQGILTQQAADAIKAEAAAYAAQKAREVTPKPAEPVEAGFGKIKFSGLSQNWFSLDTHADGGDATRDTLRLRRMELKFSGRINPQIDWAVMFDPAKQLALNVKSSGGTVTGVAPRQASTALQDVFINYTLAPNQSLRIGQYKLPLSYEGLLSSGKLDTVERAQVFSKGKLGDVRDTGIEWDGTRPGLTWQLGVFNGQGETQNTTDNNPQKCLAGRLVFNATDAFALGASGLIGRSESPTAGGRAQRLGFEAVYRGGANQLRAEYMQGTDGGNRRNGWYLLATHDLSPDWQLCARYDTYDPDHALGGNGQTDYLIGCTRFFSKHNAKIQFNYVHNQRGSVAGESGDQILVNCQIAF